jgi:hypothetical protein
MDHRMNPLEVLNVNPPLLRLPPDLRRAHGMFPAHKPYNFMPIVGQRPH